MKKFNRGPSFGMIGVVFSSIFFIAILSLALNENHIILWFILLISLTFVTLTEQVSIDFTNQKYAHGHLILGLFQTGKWKDLDNRCYLKIEATAFTKEVNYGMVNLGHATSRKCCLSLINRNLKQKWILSEGNYSDLHQKAEQVYNSSNIEIQDFIRRSNSKAPNS